MDQLLLSTLCAGSLALLSLVTFYEFELTIRPRGSSEKANSVKPVSKCECCHKTLENLVSLEKCAHKICQVCLDRKLLESPVIWQDRTGKQSKVWPCPKCKEFFMTGGKMMF